jgi:transcriptional regulator with XRE-family HTH domain
MTTTELTHKLKTYQNIDAFLHENEAEFDENAFCRYLEGLLQRKGINIATLALESGVSVPYAYNLFAGRKNAPRKDILLRLAFGLELNVDETNRLLTLGGVSELRAKVRRESIVIFCLENSRTIDAADELLHKYNLDTLL